MTQHPFEFPFSTCETSVKLRVGSNVIHSQPYSAAVNALVIVALLVLLLNPEKTPTGAPIPKPTALIWTLIAFETWHLLSHAFHHRFIATYQMFVIHFLAYLIAFQIWKLFLQLEPTNKRATWKKIVLVLFVLMDLILLFSIQGHWSVISGTFLIFLVILLYSPSIPPTLYRWALVFFIPLGVVGTALFLNEHYQCRQMLNSFKFPYHILLEIFIGVFIIALAYFFIKWMRIKN
jgi:hypothetical protein